jgi:4-hydroxy-tetrahydrodipicolinate reductase
MVKVLLNGASGKMGGVISGLAASKGVHIVAGVDAKKSTREYPVYPSLWDVKEDFDVLLDFSRADSLYPILDFIKAKGKGAVLCTTGYTKEQVEKINEASKASPIFRSGNMSLGINILTRILKDYTKILYENYDIEIVEKHHNEKIDAPSGTALMLSDAIQETLDAETNLVFGREGMKKREKTDIGMHSIRGGSIVGDHEVIFAGTGEVIELTHKAISRDVFAAGALEATKYMTGKGPGLYNMDSMLFG